MLQFCAYCWVILGLIGMIALFFRFGYWFSEWLEGISVETPEHNPLKSLNQEYEFDEKEKSKTGYKPRLNEELARELYVMIPAICRELGKCQTGDGTFVSGDWGYTYDDLIFLYCFRSHAGNYAEDSIAVSKVHPTSGNTHIVYRKTIPDKTDCPQILRNGQWVDTVRELYQLAQQYQYAREQKKLEEEYRLLHERYGDID